jgi:hypothetical protein
VSENLDLVRSVLAEWHRGALRTVEWAHPEIVFVLADGPEPGQWTGVARLAAYWRDFLRTWDDYRIRYERQP